MNRHRILASLITLLLGACSSLPQSHSLATVPSEAAPGAAAARLLPSDSLDATLWTQSAIEHDLVLRQTYHAAEEKLLKALADPAWDALPRGERVGAITGLAPAVIVDVDETVLDNSPFQARLIRDNASFNEIAWQAWCEQHAARALPGALEFARFAKAHGVSVIYISNRAQALAAVTRQNLLEQGFPVSSTEDSIYAEGVETPGCVEKSGDKGCRRKLAAQKHRILLMFGDQLGDFMDGSGTTVAARRTLAESYRDWFGERWFALPNPTYGLWQTAVTANPPASGTATDARARKHAALRDN